MNIAEKMRNCLQHPMTAELDALKRLQAETATELDALLPAILDRPFKGEIMTSTPPS